MITPADMLADAGMDYRKKITARIYGVYQERMKTANALDFDDILCLTVELFKQFPDILEKYRNRYKYIMVDEYQDTNHVQFTLVSMLSSGHNNICVVGDDDLSGPSRTLSGSSRSLSPWRTGRAKGFLRPRSC